MKLNKAAIFLILTLLSTACGNFNEPDGNVVITGKFPAYAEHQLLIHKMEVYEAKPVDTVTLDDEGLFKVGVTIDQPEFFLLKFDNRNFITLLAEPGEKIEVSGSGMIQDDGYMVQGSGGSEKIRSMKDYLSDQRMHIDSIREIYQSTGTRGEFTNPAVTMEFEKSREEIRQAIRNIILDDPSSLTSILFLNERFGQQKLFNEKKDFDLFLHVDTLLTLRYPGNIHVTDHHEKVRRAAEIIEAEKRAMQRLAPGRPAPDFTMESYRGNEVSLSDLKGKVVLLYFWASMEPGIRETNQALKKIYTQHHSDRFEIMGISLDSYEEMWRTAIRKDDLKWINVTDLQNIYSAPVFLYQVPEDLPFFYLIDKEQQIAWKGENIAEIEKNLVPLLSD